MFAGIIINTSNIKSESMTFIIVGNNIIENNYYRGDIAPWWNDSWIYRKEITVDYSLIDVTLSNFPVLIDIVDPDLTAHAQSDGDDITFRDYYGNRF